MHGSCAPQQLCDTTSAPEHLNPVVQATGPGQMSLQEMLAQGATPEEVYRMAIALAGGAPQSAAQEAPGQEPAQRAATPSEGGLKVRLQFLSLDRQVQ